MVVEAPNWTLDGRWLIVNGDGRLWRAAAEGAAELEPIDVQGIPDLNNDHMLAPDGEHIYICPPMMGTSTERRSPAGVRVV